MKSFRWGGKTRGYLCLGLSGSHDLMIRRYSFPFSCAPFIIFIGTMTNQKPHYQGNSFTTKIYVTTFPVNTLYAEIIDCLALTHILKSQYMDKYLPINLKRKVQPSSQHLCLYYPLSVFVYYSHAPSLTLPAPATTQYYSTNTATSCANI